VTEKTGLSFKSDTERDFSAAEAEVDLISRQEQQATVEAELEILRELVDSDNTRQIIKDKLSAHYQKSESGAESLYDKDKRGVEHIMKRNNAFIVHMILTSNELRHNANSNVAAHTELADDVDILLSLEPSISTSSVVPGVSSGLWGGGLGALIADGEVRTARASDDGTKSLGIKQRSEKGSKASAQSIDNYVSDRKDGGGYNEFVVNEPKVGGFFTLSTKPDENKQVEFSPGSIVKKAILLAAERGVPMFVMTDDRRVYQLESYDEVKGIGNVGSEISPQDLAKMPAGISNEHRVELGGRVLKNIPFTKLSFQQEASEILNTLGANLETAMSKDELLQAVKINPELVRDESNFPAESLGDIDFMTKLAEHNPYSAFNIASPELQNNLDFIQKIYPNFVKQKKSLLNNFSHEALLVPEVQLLAIKYEDLSDLIRLLQPDMLDNDSVKEALISRISQKWNDTEVENPTGIFVDSQPSPVVKRLIDEFGLLDYLNSNNDRLEFISEKNRILAKNREQASV
jgi:hypothetical protein